MIFKALLSFAFRFGEMHPLLVFDRKDEFEKTFATAKVFFKDKSAFRCTEMP